MSAESKASVVGAIAANFAIAATKVAAGIAGHSAAMIAEAIHSGIDGVNDLLLLYGLRQSRLPADELHPFGYGKELYFWSLIVSCSILGLGGGATIVEGILSLQEPKPIHHVLLSYLTLAAAIGFDGISLAYGWRQFRRQNQRRDFLDAARRTKDLSTVMVVLEDSAGVLGEVVAAAGIFANTHGLLRGDGIASLAIGLVLSGNAIFLIREARGLLVGEAVEPSIRAELRQLAVGDHKSLRVRAAHTMHFGPDTVLLALEAEFNPESTAGELMQAVDAIQRDIRSRHPSVQYIFLDPETARRRSRNDAPANPA